MSNIHISRSPGQLLEPHPC